MPAVAPPSRPVALHAPGEVHGELSEVLTAAGLVVTDPWDESAAHAPVVAVWAGWPPAHATDPWLHETRPHLIVTLGAAAVGVGPFVDPGLTACLRCLEAEGVLREGRDVPAHDDPRGLDGVVTLAGALAAHDIGRWYAGTVPATWSATLTVDARLDTSRRAWLRHPHCGCSWGLAADPA